MINNFSFFTSIPDPLFTTTFSPIINPILNSQDSTFSNLKNLAQDDFEDFLGEIFSLTLSSFSIIHISAKNTGELYAAIPLESIINTQFSGVLKNLNKFSLFPCNYLPSKISPDQITINFG